MEERQHDQVTVIRPELEGSEHVIDPGERRPVGVHHPLGQAGRARGVDDGQRIVTARGDLRLLGAGAVDQRAIGGGAGNGRRIAESLYRDAEATGLPVRLVSLADYRPADIRKETLLALVVSTHGEGDPPDDAEPMYEYLFGPRAPKLEGLAYTVLALGDSSYDEFCKTGRDFDERLQALGGKPFRARIDCDVDYEADASAWGETTLVEARERLAAHGPAAVTPLHAVARTGAAAGPVRVEVAVNQRITARESTKCVHHVEFALPEGGIGHEPGDALAVVTANPPRLVEEIIGLLGLPATAALDDGRELAGALGSDYEITTASRAFVARYAEASGSDALGALLGESRRAELARYLAGRQVVDVVREHPAALSPADFVACLRGLKPRLYSIASSPLATPDEVHVTVAEVAYTAFGRTHWGAASSHIVSRLAVGDGVEIRLEPNPRFRLPADGEAPVVMIGPGTGVAPFRAFLEHREAAGAGGRNWLFFGERNFYSDFLYQLDWARFRKRGVLDRMDVAFSRDGERKVYVQHRMMERAAELYAWLEEGAFVYVCGDATRMAPDVHAALVSVVMQGGAVDADAAEAYLREMKRGGRYQRDVY